MSLRHLLGPALAAALLCAPPAWTEESTTGPVLEWMAGPGTAPLGRDLAEIDVPEGYVFLDAEGTRRLMELLENPVSNTEVGTVAPASDEESWLLIFEWDPVGYVPDGDADELDADGLLASIREATEAANREREARGWAPMQILGWHEEPHYDPDTNDLTWAIVGGSDGGRTINKIVKLLGRHGVMTVTLVAGPEELAGALPRTEAVLAGYRFRPGSTYAEYIPGKDKLAEFGLTALVVGGAGAALVQSGLLARFWKVIVAGVAALLAGARSVFGSRRAEDEPISRV